MTALYLAANRWGNGQGIYDYKAWADTILTRMRHQSLRLGPEKPGQRTAGIMVNEARKIILFVPKSAFSDSSYHLPAFYELWAHWGPVPDRAFWAAATDTSRAYFLKAAHPQTGLAADYADFDGQPVTTSYNPNSYLFAYDSWWKA